MQTYGQSLVTKAWNERVVVDSKVIEGFDEAENRDKWAKEVLESSKIDRITSYKKLSQPEDVKEVELEEEKQSQESEKVS